MPTAAPRVRFLCLPDLDKPIGGAKQLYRQVEQLVALGIDAAIVTEHDGFRPSWFTSTAPTAGITVCRERGDFEPDVAIVVIPETFLGINLQNFHGVDLSRLARVLYNQNAYYSYVNSGERPMEVLARFYDAPEVLQILCVSEDSHQFLRHNLGIPDERLSRVIHAIEPIFQPDPEKTNRVVWMARKNPEHVQAILLGLRRGRLQHLQGWQASGLGSMPHATLAEQLNRARLFLSFGHPEGFGLPVAEAMAAGCYVVGYSGGGADELFRHGLSEPVRFGDWSGFLDAIQQALRDFAEAPRETALRLERQALAIRTLYSQEQETASIRAAWERIQSAFQHWQSERANSGPTA